MSAKEHLQRVRELPCVVCKVMGINQSTPTQAHHVESVRDATSDFAVAAICADHHMELHRLSRREFERRTKLTPIDLLSLTIKQLDMRKS